MASQKMSANGNEGLDSTGAMELFADAKLRKDGLGSLGVLPDHLLSYIMYLLDVEDMVRVSCVSRLLRVLGCEEPLWLALSLKLQNGLVEYKANWRQTALASYRRPRAGPVPPLAVAAAARPPAPLPGLASLFLYKRWYRCHVDLRGFLPPPDAATVPRVAAAGGPAAAAGAGMSPAEFRRLYDGPGLPVLLQGLQDSWPAACWSLPALCAAFPAAAFKVTKPHGGRALMTLPAYVDYMARQADEEPLYIFDPDFVEAAPGLRRMYDIPAVFEQDYMGVLPGGGRPHHRWLVLGPARAGASWHVDPSLTSAWNALLSGRKRWALYPPHSPPPGVPLSDDGEEARPDDADGLTSLQWWLEVYPSLPPERRPIEFVQEPGEVVYIPGGWWHAVLNLETAVAVTQNYVGDANLPRVVAYMAAGSSAYFRQPLSYYSREEVAAWRAAYPGPIAASDAAARAAAAARDGAGSGGDDTSGSEDVSGSEVEVEVEGEGAGDKAGRVGNGGSDSSDVEGCGSESGSDPAASCLDENGVEGSGGGGVELAAAAAVVGAGDGGGGDNGGCSIRPLASRWLLGPAWPSREGGVAAATGAGSEAEVGAEVEAGAVALLPLGPRSAAAAAAATATAGGGAHGTRTRTTTTTITGAASKQEQEEEAEAETSSGKADEAVQPDEEDDEGGPWEGPDAPPALRCWRRERILGRWLRRLWEQRPELRPALGCCLAASTAAPIWAAVLAAVARQHNTLLRRAAAAACAAGAADGSSAEEGAHSGGGPCNGHAGTGSQQGLVEVLQGGAAESQSLQSQSLLALQALVGAPEGRGLLGLELMPLVGADALVFLTGAAAAAAAGSTSAAGSTGPIAGSKGAHGVAVKVFTHELPAMRGLMCALEAHVPLLLRGRLTAAAAHTTGLGPTAPGLGGGSDDSHGVAAAAAAAALEAAEQVPLPASCGLLSVRFPQAGAEAHGPGDADEPRHVNGGRRRHRHNGSSNPVKEQAPAAGEQQEEQEQQGAQAAAGQGRQGTKRSAAAADLSPREAGRRRTKAVPPSPAGTATMLPSQQLKSMEVGAVKPLGEGGAEEHEEPPQPPQPSQRARAALEHRLLYLVEQRMQGSHVLPELWDELSHQQRQQLATALGHLIGRMHRAAAATAASAAAAASGTAAAVAPQAQAQMETGLKVEAAAPPRATLAGVGGSSWESLLRSRGVWHDRDGRIWVSGLGRVCSPHVADDSDSDSDVEGDGDEEAAARDGGGSSADGKAGGGPSADGGEGAAAAAVVAAPSAAPQRPRRRCHVPLDSPWWPFVSHLRRRQRRLLRRLALAAGPVAAAQPLQPAAHGSGPVGGASAAEGGAAAQQPPPPPPYARPAAGDADEELPVWVRQQLPAYLPEDPAQLLGFQLQPPEGERREEAGGEEAVAAANGGGGAADSGPGPGMPPLLLHGDVTSSNVVLQPPPRAAADCAAANGGAAGADVSTAVPAAAPPAAAATAATAWSPVPRLVDFSDAGHGDPLAELVPVLASCLGCHVGHMRAFWAAYTAHVDPRGPSGSSTSGRGDGGGSAGATGESDAGTAVAAAARGVWPLRGSSNGGGDGGGGRVVLSYAAMCYCLIHEEVDVLLERAWDSLGAVAAVAPAAADTAAGPTLERLATALWGFLDEAEEGGRPAA